MSKRHDSYCSVSTLYFILFKTTSFMNREFEVKCERDEYVMTLQDVVVIYYLMMTILPYHLL